MSATKATVDLEQNPAVVRFDWTPGDTPWDALNDLHDEHIATLGDLKEVGQEYRALVAKYEQEDQATLDAQTAAYTDGVEDPKLPKATSQAMREQNLNAVLTKGKVIQQHLRELVATVVHTVQQNEGAWLGELAQQEAEARQRVNQLKRELAEAETLATHGDDLRNWLGRTARNKPGFHLHWSWYSNKPTTDLQEIANQGRNRFNSVPSTYMEQQDQRNGGGVVEDNPGDPDFSNETMDYTSDTYLDTLDEGLREHVKQRRAGGAAPGGL